MIRTKFAIALAACATIASAYAADDHKAPTLIVIDSQERTVGTLATSDCTRN